MAKCHVIFPLCGCKTAPQASAPVFPHAPAPAPTPRGIPIPRPLVTPEPEVDADLVNKLKEVAALRAKIQRRKQRENLSLFFKAAWAAMNPGTPLEWGFHVQAVCDHIQWQLEDRARAEKDPNFKLRAQDVVINVPPRSLKTSILTIATIWAWLRWPEMRIMYLSANPRVALNSARQARDLIVSEWFKNTHQPDWTIRTDQNALSDLGNTKGGARIARGLDSTITGEGCVTGDTLVATEWGDIPIVELGAMNPRPRVWSRNLDTGELELKHVTKWALTGYKSTVQVRTLSGHVLRLTDDHEVWTPDGFRPATHVAGCTVSVLPGTERALEGAPAEMQPVRMDRADLCGLPDALLEGDRGAREESAPVWHPADLLAALQLRAEPGPGEGEYGAREGRYVCAVRDGVQTGYAVDIEALLLEAVPRGVRPGSPNHQDADTQGLRVLPVHLRTDYESYCLLHTTLQGLGPQHPNAGLWKLELQRRAQALLRRAVGELGAPDPRARRTSMHGLRGHEPTAGGGTPHRSQPVEQRAGEPDHTVRRVSPDASQIQARPDTVLSVDAPATGGCLEAVPVYDITVEGNHNFFANGVLVHNCLWLIIDDPHDLRDSIENIEKCIEGYDSAVHNRINNPRASIRTCIMQRVNVADFTAHVLKKGWMHVRIPMEYETKSVCTCSTCVAGVNSFGWRDPRCIDGERLHPRFDEDFIAKERVRLGSYGYNCQHQQRPAVAGGGRIKKEFWGFCRISGHFAGDHPRPPGCNETSEVRVIDRVVAGPNRGKLDLDWLVLSVDAANKKTERGSAYGLLAIGGKDMRRYVLDDRTTRGEFPEILDILRQMIIQWKPEKVLVEAKAAGPSLMSSLDSEMKDGKLRYHEDGCGALIREVEVKEFGPKGPVYKIKRVCRGCQAETDGTPVLCAVEAIEVDIDKERRVDAVLPQIEARAVYLMEGAGWLGEFVEEHALFPQSPWNDRVDALSQVLEYYRSGPFYVL